MSFRLMLVPRFIPLGLSARMGLVSLVAMLSGASSILPVIGFLIGAGLTLLGLHDLGQTRHAVLRNYPVSGHLRFLLESIRPEMRGIRRALSTAVSARRGASTRSRACA